MKSSNSSRFCSSVLITRFSIPLKYKFFHGGTCDISKSHARRACYKIESPALTQAPNPVVEHEKKPKTVELEKKGMVNLKPILEDNIRDLYCSSIEVDDYVNFADLGCSLGPNTDATSPLSEVAESVYEECNCRLSQDPHVNSTCLASRPCFVPKPLHGSCYGRLFPDKSIHFLHSSYHLNWLSRVPKRLVSEDGREANKGNICVAKESPIRVQGAYSNQFETDLFGFLRSRSHEVVPQGRVLVSFMGTNHDKAPNLWELLGTTLNDVMMQGLIEESTLATLNIPFYAPCYEELRVGIMKEGSFTLAQHQVVELNWNGDLYDKCRVIDGVRVGFGFGGESAMMTFRTAGEVIFGDRLGDEITSVLFRRHCEKMAGYFKTEQGLWTNHVISLIKN